MTTNIIIGLRASFTTADLQKAMDTKIKQLEKKLPDLINYEMSARRNNPNAPVQVATMTTDMVRERISFLRFWKSHLHPEAVYLLSIDEVNLVITPE